METKNMILIAIAILAIILIAVGIYSISTDNSVSDNTTDNNTTDFIDIGTINADDLKNNTVVGDNSTLNKSDLKNNTTYKLYNPQSDSYVPVIGEKYDDEVNRWYTYDADGVRYYNTRIN